MIPCAVPFYLRTVQMPGWGAASHYNQDIFAGPDFKRRRYPRISNRMLSSDPRSDSRWNRWYQMFRSLKNANRLLPEGDARLIISEVVRAMEVACAVNRPVKLTGLSETVAREQEEGKRVVDERRRRRAQQDRERRRRQGAQPRQTRGRRGASQSQVPESQNGDGGEDGNEGDDEDEQEGNDGEAMDTTMDAAAEISAEIIDKAAAEAIAQMAGHQRTRTGA